MLEVDTKIKRIRGTDHCQRGHNRWGYLPKKKTRYCLDCENHRAMTRKYKRGIIGRKAVLLLEENLNFEISTIKSHIEVLEEKVKKLEAEKATIRSTYETRVAERKKKKEKAE